MCCKRRLGKIRNVILENFLQILRRLNCCGVDAGLHGDYILMGFVLVCVLLKTRSPSMVSIPLQQVCRARRVDRHGHRKTLGYLGTQKTRIYVVMESESELGISMKLKWHIHSLLVAARRTRHFHHFVVATKRQIQPTTASYQQIHGERPREGGSPAGAPLQVSGEGPGYQYSP